MAAINLKNIPDHILKYLLRLQFEAKSSKKVSQYSLQKIVYKIIEEHEINFKRRNSPFNLINTQTLISNGWSKKDGVYTRGNDTAKYDGMFWYFNDEKLTEDNYIDKIYDKSKAKL